MRHAQTTSTTAEPSTAEFGRRFVGKVALVTGPSDRATGGASAERLAQEGAALAMVSRAEPKRLLKRLDRLEATAAWWHCDITSSAEVKPSVDRAVADFGRIDVLVNNAGV